MCFNRDEAVSGEVQREDDISLIMHDFESPPEEPVNEVVARTLNEVNDAQMEDELYLVTQMCLLELTSMIKFSNCAKCNGTLKIDTKQKGTAVVFKWVS